jgi:Lipid-binding putative hydrolase
MKYRIFILAVAIVALSSCKKNLPDPGHTAPQNLANEWWVTFTLNGADLYNLGHQKIATYNTAANTSEIWVDDLESTWDFKVKATADLNNLTFAASKAQNQYYNITADITNGKVLPNAGHSKTGKVTDSIYMQVKFSDDPGNTYTIAGTARTRWAEDDY